MVVREKVTLAVLAVLVATGAWFAQEVRARGLAAETGWQMLAVTLAIIVASAVLAGGIVALGPKARQVDERDNRIALMSQSFRGFLYLGLSFGVLGLAVGNGNYALANGIFLAILGIEIVSGLVMLVLYRTSA
ncbi:hypothetical protein [Parvularcula lutaonensis]|uniref:DUF2178 domain-containing protein n=1 Tax=Parvularcula lutaonensis TaxID=491923 RepID=A0ABV7MAX0_9PROT|nr:hypothetical protein [Parvularcula lutaonensis]GGY46935.1 hypothetical protein GCM10007148_15170 [Parvularcula lutaonensis]